MAYKLGKYEGCGKCPKRGNCKASKRENIKVRFKKRERADDWGRMVTVFGEGEEVEANCIVDGDTILCATATSNIYPEYSDFISLENIELVTN